MTNTEREAFDVTEISEQIADTIAKVTKPLTIEQKVSLSACLGVWLLKLTAYARQDERAKNVSLIDSAFEALCLARQCIREMSISASFIDDIRERRNLRYASQKAYDKFETLYTIISDHAKEISKCNRVEKL